MSSTFHLLQLVAYSLPEVQTGGRDNQVSIQHNSSQSAPPVLNVRSCAFHNSGLKVFSVRAPFVLPALPLIFIYFIKDFEFYSVPETGERKENTAQNLISRISKYNVKL